MQFKETKTKRQIVAKLEPGEDLMEALEACVEKCDIKSGFIHVIGGLDKITYGVYNAQKKEYEQTERIGFHELLGMGNITQKDGAPFIHVHIFANNNNCEPCGGHLLKGCNVFPFAEVFIQEPDSEITRAYDESTDLWPIKLTS